MNVLIFSHETDIDGMGGVILASLAFHYVTYELTTPEKLPSLLKDFIEDDSIYNFDKIFVTDMWLEDPMLTQVAEDKDLAGKFYIFDSHRSAIEATYDRYPFTIIKAADDYGKCCGTSLFYEYLLENNYLKKSAKGIYKFVELTRKYDTWEWKTRYQDSEPEELAILYESIGNDMYIDLMINKLRENDFHFCLDENDIKKVETKKLQNKKSVELAIKTKREKTVGGYKAVIVDSEYQYRNFIAEYFREDNNDYDFVMIVARDRGTVSFRTINQDVNVRMIAEDFGGTGHDFAAKAKINDALEKIIEKKD